MERWVWKLSIPLACSCAPWVWWFTAVSAAIKYDNDSNHDLEGALAYAALLGIVSFLATGPIAAAQLRLAPRSKPLALGTYALIYYAISAPTLLFQAVALSSSFLTGFVPGSGLVINTSRTIVLTALLGILVYAIFAAAMNAAIGRIAKSVP